MIWFALIVVYLFVGFGLAVVWHLLDWSDVTEDFMVLTFMIAWPLIVVIYLVCAISIPIEKMTTRLAKNAVNTIKRWSKK